MTAPDKPLHEQCAEHTSAAYHGLWVVKARRLLREAADELSRQQADIDMLHDTLGEEVAELSRMRTALEEIRAKQNNYRREGFDYIQGVMAGYNDCALIAERALTAGSGK